MWVNNTNTITSGDLGEFFTSGLGKNTHTTPHFGESNVLWYTKSIIYIIIYKIQLKNGPITRVLLTRKHQRAQAFPNTSWMCVLLTRKRAKNPISNICGLLWHYRVKNLECWTCFGPKMPLSRLQKLEGPWRQMDPENEDLLWHFGP